MIAIDRLTSSVDCSIKNIIKKIDENSVKTVFIVDQNSVLLGTITDGDIRRWILKNGSLDDEARHIMHTHPIFVRETNKGEAYTLMIEKGIGAIPLLNETGQIVDVFLWSSFQQEKFKRYGKMDVPVVIMAGGKGNRLYPYTKILPKPLIPIGEIPIVERIIMNFVDFGCNDFYLTVNYKKNMIQSYFSDIQKNYEVSYIEENKPLGTAGSLFLLKDILKETFFLSNCDILIDADYSSIYQYHKKNNNKITIVTSLKNYILPYGVVELDKDSQVIALKEKPENHYLINTGMYIIEPELIEKIPQNEFYHITELIEQCIQDGIRVGAYPISEGSWLDMGEFKEMDIMIEKLGIRE